MSDPSDLQNNTQKPVLPLTPDSQLQIQLPTVGVRPTYSQAVQSTLSPNLQLPVQQAVPLVSPTDHNFLD